MKVLIDTNIFLWLTTGQTNQLSAKALRTVRNPAIGLVVSIASIWEVALKLPGGKLKVKLDQSSLEHHMELLDATLLPIKPGHIFETLSLPRIHHDPYDRMLIAQAIVEELDFVTPDVAIHKYPVRIIW